MRALTQGELLALWEAGRSLEPLDRGVLAACAASSGPQNAADWPLGTRNRSLAQLHCAMFGGMLRGWAACHGCGEQLEFEFDGHRVANAQLEQGPEAVEAERRMVAVGGWLFRLPTSRDLGAAAEEASEPAAVRRIVNSCWVGPEAARADWSDDELEAIEARLAEADPLAEVRLHFDCPACSASFDETLDLGSFVWADIETRAKRILSEVHTLACAYGWSENQILALSPGRRSAYLDFVRT